MGDGVLFWGKYDKRTGRALPLLLHSLDVALVFRFLCEIKGIKRALAETTAQTLTSGLFDRLAVLAMLHDLGKANLGFQDKIKPGNYRAGHIRELEPLFLEPDLNTLFFQSLPSNIESWFTGEAIASSYFFAIFSHHGRPVEFLGNRTGNYYLARDLWWRSSGARDPFRVMGEISEFSQYAFPQAFDYAVQTLPPEPEFHHRFAGLVMLADWLGSHDHWFPVSGSCAKQRLHDNKQIIPRMLNRVGLDSEPLRPCLKTVGADFHARFRFKPYPLQSITDNLDPNDPMNRLLIVESETGSGKTEAALNWFAKLFTAGKVDSLYFALPTRVAAREMYERIHSQIQRWFPIKEQRPVVLLAIPGYAQVDGLAVQQLLPSFNESNIWEDDPRQAMIERHWAGALPKRFLAAAVAVGTVDQVLLSAVQTSHAHLRSVCLDRSLLVIDEVHASDVYMSFLLKSLLKHHLSVGGSAMLLSATLGTTAMHNYLELTSKSSQTPSFSQAIKAPFPALTAANGTMLSTDPGSTLNKSIAITVVPLGMNPSEIIDAQVLSALKAGAKVLVILNTVNRAIDLFKYVEKHPGLDTDWLFSCLGRSCPHHGRFAAPDRALLDQEVTKRFGKRSPSGPVLLIGTQTLEQSLDIDADFLITDLAPSDVLLQRIGRLHRHVRERPQGYENPRCVVLAPDKDLDDALKRNGEVRAEYARMGLGSVYQDLRMLELTLRILRANTCLTIPRDNRALVEAATHPEMLAEFKGPRWEAHRLLVEGTALAKAVTAHSITGLFGSFFGQTFFADVGRSVSTRLGNNLYRVELAKTAESPFGLILEEIFVAEHMMPRRYDPEEKMEVTDGEEGLFLQYGDMRYGYSRYGLEVLT